MVIMQQETAYYVARVDESIQKIKAKRRLTKAKIGLLRAADSNDKLKLAKLEARKAELIAGDGNEIEDFEDDEFESEEESA
jgi:hypothetical protein